MPILIGMSAAQQKLLELLATGGITAATIFFTLLTVLYASIQAIGPTKAEARPIRTAITLAVAGVAVSLAYSAGVLWALAVDSPEFFRLAIWVGALIGIAVIAAAIWLRRKS